MRWKGRSESEGERLENWEKGAGGGEMGGG